MELSYSCAIVSFCPDLTARDAPSIPVGVLLVGQLGDNGLASVLVPSVRMPRLDEKSGWTIGDGAPSARPPESRQIDLGAIHDVNSTWRYEAAAASRAS